MKKVALLLVVVLVLVAGVGCYGTRNITRQLDDWGNDMQTNNAWLAQPVGWFVLPIASFFTIIVDGVVDTYYFWSTNAWSNKGTPFVHKVVTKAAPAAPAAK
jgi:predicted DNA repair protein MutK